MKIFIIIIGFIEAFYVIYMMRYFKTTISFDYGRNLDNLYKIASLFGLSNDYIKHNIKKSDIPVGHVCRFGRDVSFLIAAFFIIRSIIFLTKSDNILWSWNVNIFIDLIILLVSFSNFNVIVYLMPIFIIELCIILYFKCNKYERINNKNKIDIKIQNKFKSFKDKRKLRKSLKSKKQRKEYKEYKEFREHENFKKTKYNKDHKEFKKLKKQEKKKRKKIEKI